MARKTSAEAGKSGAGQTDMQNGDAAAKGKRANRGVYERIPSTRFLEAERALRTLFGRNMREARQRAGLTQAEVAAIIDTEQPYVGAVERGEQNVTLAVITRIAYAVRADPGALLLGDGAENYSLETLVRIVGALHTYLEATMDKHGPEGFSESMLAIIPRSEPPKCKAGGEPKSTTKPVREKK
jgi:transcriptional regulator with XRE-family HTH domain